MPVTSPPTTALVVGHSSLINLAIILNDSQFLKIGAKGFPSDRMPLEWISERIAMLQADLTNRMRQAREEENMPPELLAWWPFREGAGLVTRNIARDDYHGTLPTAIDWTTGRAEKSFALSFTSASQRVRISDIDIDSDELSLAAWVKATGWSHYHDNRIISKATSRQLGDHYWMLSTAAVSNSTRLRFRLKTGNETTELVASSGDLELGEWYHVGASYDGQYMRLFLDGQQVGQTGKTGTVAVNAEVRTEIGNNPNSHIAWQGLIDTVQLYTVALTVEDFKELAGK